MSKRPRETKLKKNRMKEPASLEKTTSKFETNRVNNSLAPEPQIRKTTHADTISHYQNKDDLQDAQILVN